MSMTKTQAMAAVTADGVHGADADKQAECLQASVNGLLGLGLSPWDIFAKFSKIIEIVSRAGNTLVDWVGKIKDIFALFGKTVPPTVQMP